MTLTNGRFEPDDADDIIDDVLSDAKDYWGDDLNDDELAAVRLFYLPIADKFADIQDDIKAVLDSAQLNYASGDALDLLTALIGVPREPATTASGTVLFSRATRTDRNYTIQSETEVQTDSDNPVVFETTETKTLPLLDDFNSGSLDTDYEGDTGDVTVQSSTTLEGSDTLELSATNGAHVYHKGKTVEQGVVLHYYAQCSVDTTTIFTFGAADQNNYYQIVLDNAADRIALESIENGNSPSTVVEATGKGLPANERLDVRLQWDRDGQFAVTVTDASGNQVAEIEATDTTHTEGYIGFKSGDATDTKYVDYVTTSRVPAPIEAQESGPDSNVGKNAVVIMPDPPTGIESVTNPSATTGGSEEEGDTALRERAKDELADGSRCTEAALISAARGVDDTTSVSIFDIDNDSDSEEDGFELVVEGGNDEAIAQAILDNMAAGDTSWGGINATAASASADLPNGQTRTIEFSRPTTIDIYADMSLEVTDEYDGDDAVRDAIAEYIGGLLASGNEITGLGAGDDVLYGEVEYAIRTVPGVYDVTSLDVDTSDPPNNQQNIQIADSEVARADATDSSISMSTTTVSP